MLFFRSAGPWLARLGLLGQLVVLTSLGAAAPAAAAPADQAVATATVASGGDGAAGIAVDAGPPAARASAAGYGLTEADSGTSSPRTNGALLGGLLGALGGLVIAGAAALVRRAVGRREHRARMPFPQHASVPVPGPPAPATYPPPAAAPAPAVGSAPAAVPVGGGRSALGMPAVGTAVPPPARTAPPVPVGPPEPAQQPRHGPRCARCRELVPAGATYCGECGQSQLEPPFGQETAGADRGVRQLLRDRPGLSRRWRLIAAVAAVVTLVAAVAFSWQASPMSARDTVEAFYEALADRDADRARSLLSLNLVNRAQPMLTSGAALRNPGYHPPRHLRITRMDVRDDVGEMAGEYELDGKRQKTGLYLIRDGRGGERRPWSINYLPGLEPPSGAYGFEALLVAGTRVPAGFIEAVFQGSYVVSLPDHPIREVEAPVTVRAGDREGGVLRVRMRDSARPAIETQVRAYLDRCAASTELAPKGCPFSAWSPTAAKDVAWRITRYPTLEIALGSGSEAQVFGDEGTVTVNVGGAVLAENMSFTVHGYGRAAGDMVVFVPR